MFLFNLIGTIFLLIVGSYILFAGRKAIWVTLGMISFSAALNLLAVLLVGLDNGYALFQAQEWWIIGLSVGIGVAALFLGRAKPNIGVLLIGFMAGADMALWVYEIATYVVTNLARQSEQTAFYTGLIILLIGGLLGLWLVRTAKDEALIIITMIVGAQLIQDTLRLSKTSSWTAIIVVTLALAGVMVQYTLYLREQKANQTNPEPVPSSVAYFQDLELHR